MNKKEEILSVFDRALSDKPVATVPAFSSTVLDILVPEGCMRVEFNGRLEIDETGNILEEDSDGIVQK